jgi:hypothetical protein
VFEWAACLMPSDGFARASDGAAGTMLLCSGVAARAMFVPGFKISAALGPVCVVLDADKPNSFPGGKFGAAASWSAAWKLA